MATVTPPAHAREAPARRTIEVVPRAGLPFAAAAVLGLIVAIAGNWLWAIEFFHVVGGGAWTTLDLFLGFVLGPIIGRMSIPARIELSSRLMPILVLLIPTLVTMTLGSGFQLAHNLGYLDSSYPRHGWVVASFVVVGIMAVIAIGYLEPANIAVLWELKKPNPDGELIQMLMRRFLYVAGITGAMQVATLVIMTRIAT
ncbi:MAG TPA: hypothetical protein VGF23_09595 [Gaiellaceae bacterium]|jgi:hypothetical protein